MNGLTSLNGWGEKRTFFAPHSAQGYFNSERVFSSQSVGGSSCGSGDTKPQPSSCGASSPAPKPSSCGAGDDTKPKSACGAGGK